MIQKSSGEIWTAEEEERLFKAVLTLVTQFEGRSFGAVVTRIALLAPRWWRRIQVGDV
jgi:hypothetical protein